MQFNMQIKHFFCIYPCILVDFFIVRPFPEYPDLPDERAARSVISGRGRSPFRLSRFERAARSANFIAVPGRHY